MTTPSAVPYVHCGRDPEIAAAVELALQPEYNAIATFHTIEQIRENLPNILSRRAQLQENSPASEMPDFPRAVIFGTAFPREQVLETMKLANADQVVWLHDSRKLTKEDVQGIPKKELGTTGGRRIKACLTECLKQEEGGSLDESKPRYLGSLCLY
ncbi:hypothetical protein A0O28_0084560 [Trichoderma guizhouense]|uniref:Uncharacterized protein n=1 Tax=Trichoderma guizhouense TaxID=1491466 RepID=A0A1T3CP04_9HYPO|nr:hypothetical protein A0O28_0084560 [Trichoderma guizhouense]